MVSEQTVRLDSGPWVAFLNRRDQYHAWVTTQFAQLRPPLLTCEAVVSETCFLVRTWRGGAEAALAFLERGVVQVPFRLQDEHLAIKTLLARYADVPMSLADACLVRMSEQYSNSLVLTCDSDFRHYRRHRRHFYTTADSSITVLPQMHDTFLGGFALYESRLDKHYSLADCVSMEAMRREGLTKVLTNDHHFTQEGFHVLFP